MTSQKIQAACQLLLQKYPTYDDFSNMMCAAGLEAPRPRNKPLVVVIEQAVRASIENGGLAALGRVSGVAMPMFELWYLDHGPSRGRDGALRVGFITMKCEELDGVLARMPGHQVVDSNGRFYYRTRVGRGRRRSLDVIALKTLTQGNLSAASAVQTMFSTWEPDYVFLCGIAGAIHKDIRIGDVAVAEQVFYYEMAKIDEGQTRSRTVAWNLSARLRAAAAIASRHSWAESTASLRPEMAPPQPKVLLCPIGSGDKLIADSSADEIRRLRAANNKIAALEMEAAGAASAAHELGRSEQLIVVRGISDHADAAKDDRFQRYASDTAAAFSFALLDFLE